MKYFKTLLIFAVLFTTSNVSAQTTFDKWPAIKAFHEVLSQTFHPSETGNMEPIKKRSKELAMKAQDLLKSDIPAEFKTKEILASAEKLQIKTKDLNTIINNASDAEITKYLGEIHDTFHQIVGLCSSEKH